MIAREIEAKLIFADVVFWLQADIQSPEIDFRSTPNTGHSEAHAGLPLVTLSGRSLDYVN